MHRPVGPVAAVIVARGNRRTGRAGVHHDGSMLRGRVLMDSLRVGAELAVPDLRARRLGREDVSASASATQPKIWAFTISRHPMNVPRSWPPPWPRRSYPMTDGMPTSRSVKSTWWSSLTECSGTSRATVTRIAKLSRAPLLPARRNTRSTGRVTPENAHTYRDPRAPSRRSARLGRRHLSGC